MLHKYWSKNLKERGNLGFLRVKSMIMLKMQTKLFGRPKRNLEYNIKRILEAHGVMALTGINWLITGHNGGVFEHGNKTFRSIKIRNFLAR